MYAGTPANTKVIVFWVFIPLIKHCGCFFRVWLRSHLSMCEPSCSPISLNLPFCDNLSVILFRYPFIFMRATAISED